MKAFIRQVKSNAEPVYVYIVLDKKRALELIYKNRQLIEGPTIEDLDHALFRDASWEKEYKELNLSVRYVRPLVKLAEAEARAALPLKVINFFVDPDKLDSEPSDEEIGMFFLEKGASAIGPKERAQVKRIRKEVLKHVM